MIICIDFDGTICRNAYPSIGEPIDGAIPTIRELHEAGHYLIIWTCRTGELLKDAVNWLLEHKIPFDRINDHNPENLARYGDAGQKVYADVYIDDKNVGGLPSWFEIPELIKAQIANK